MVVDNVGINGRYTFVVLKTEHDKHHLKHLFKAISPGCRIITSEGATGSQAGTVRLAQASLDNDSPLLIVNCHQYIDWDSRAFYAECCAAAVDGVIATFESTHPRYSYVETTPGPASGSAPRIVRVADKSPISNQATCGNYCSKSHLITHLEACTSGNEVATFLSTSRWRARTRAQL